MQKSLENCLYGRYNPRLSAHVVAADVKMIKTEGAPKGLILNEKKSEIITLEGQTIELNNLFI